MQGRDPERDKELDYTRQRRSGAEYPHAWRRMLPQKKARSQRVRRRGASAELREACGAVDPIRAEDAGLSAERVRRPVVRAWPNPTLRDHVTAGLRNRVERTGWNYFKEPYSSARHRRPFVRFLGALTHGESRVLAERFDAILHRSPPGHRDRVWLTAFFADEPSWEGRLCDWAARGSA